MIHPNVFHNEGLQPIEKVRLSPRRQAHQFSRRPDISQPKVNADQIVQRTDLQKVRRERQDVIAFPQEIEAGEGC